MKHLLAALSLAALLTACPEKPGPSPAQEPRAPASAPAGIPPDEAPAPKKLPRPEEFGPHPVVEFQTSLGTFQVTLDAEKAPRTVHTILLYCLEGFYKNTIFHRVTSFCVQGGGTYLSPTGKVLKKKPTHPRIPNEAKNGLVHEKGVIAMARLPHPDSATYQFYIALRKVLSLDGKYTIFGKVTKGMEVIEEMAGLEMADPAKGVPLEPPVIQKVVVKKG